MTTIIARREGGQPPITHIGTSVAALLSQKSVVVQPQEFRVAALFEAVAGHTGITAQELGGGRVRFISKEDPLKRVDASFVNGVWYLVSDFPCLPAPLSQDPAVFAGLKLSSLGGLFTSVIGLMQDLKDYESATRINDVAGRQFAQMRFFRRGVEFLSAAVLGTIRGLTIASLYTASKTMAVALSVLNIVSTAIASLYYACIAIPQAITLARTVSLQNKLKAAESPQAKLEILLDFVRLNDNDYFEAFKVMPADNEPTTLYQMLGEAIHLSEAEGDLLTAAERNDIEGYIDDYVEGLDRARYPAIQDWNQVKQHLGVRFAKECARIKMVKENTYTRMGDTETLKLLKEAIPDIDGIGLDAATVVGKVEALLKKNVAIKAVLMVTVILGIASFIAATIFTGGVPLIVAISIMMVSNILMMGIDGYFFLESMKDKTDSSWKERALLAIFIVLTLIAIGTGVYFSASLMTTLIITITGAVMLATQGAAIARSYQAEEKQIGLKLDRDLKRIREEGEQIRMEQIRAQQERHLHATALARQDVMPLLSA